MPHLFPHLSTLAEAILSLALSNAWPERGASALKRVETRMRSRLSDRMLEALLHITINGPNLGTEKCRKLVQKAYDRWLSKGRKKMGPSYRHKRRLQLKAAKAKSKALASVKVPEVHQPMDIQQEEDQEHHGETPPAPEEEVPEEAVPEEAVQVEEQVMQDDPVGLVLMKTTNVQIVTWATQIMIPLLAIWTVTKH